MAVKYRDADAATNLPVIKNVTTVKILNNITQLQKRAAMDQVEFTWNECVFLHFVKMIWLVCYFHSFYF